MIRNFGYYVINDVPAESGCYLFKYHQFAVLRCFVILEKNKAPKLTEDMGDKIESEHGEAVLRRIEYKMKRHVYFLARLDSEVNADQLRKDMEPVPVFTPRKRLSANAIKEELEDRAQKEIEGVAFDNSINLAVALNPTFFLERKNLREEYLIYALENLKGKIDFEDAARLYKTYFSDSRLSKYCDIVFEVASEFPQSKRFFSINLLGHENERVKTLFKQYLNENFHMYLIPVLESNLTEDDKKQILSEANYTKETQERLAQYLNQISRDENKITSLTYLFQTLPKDIKLSLPIEMRFIESLSKFYFEFSKESPREDNYTDSEVRSFFARLPKGATPDNSMVSAAIVISKDDIQFGNQLFSYIRSQDASWVARILESYEVDIQHLTASLKVGAEGEELFKIREFEKRYLNIESDEDGDEDEDIRIDALVGRYKKLFNAYFLPRKSFSKNKDEFLKDLDSLCESLAKDFNIPIVEVQLLLNGDIGKVLPHKPTPKSELMNQTANFHLHQESTKSLEQLGNIDLEARHRIMNIIWKGGYSRYSTEESLSRVIDKKPEIITYPAFIEEVKEIINGMKDADGNWHISNYSYDNFLNTAIKHRDQIPDEELRKLLGFLGYLYQRRKDYFEDFTKFFDENPSVLNSESVVSAVERLNWDFLKSRFDQLPDRIQKGLIVKIAEKLSYQFSAQDLEFLDKKGRNEFRVTRLEKQFSRELVFSGYSALTVAGYGYPVFVPRSLSPNNLGLNAISGEPVNQNVYLKLLRSTKGDKAIGQIYFK